MQTTSTTIFAALAFLAINLGYAQAPRSEPLDDGTYFLTSISDPVEGFGELFPSCTLVTIKKGKDGISTLRIEGPPSDPEPKDVEILRTHNGIQFQILQKDEGFLTVYSAMTLDGKIQGWFYSIHGGRGMSHKGKFSLQKQK
jgi:hypothetical protein